MVSILGNKAESKRLCLITPPFLKAFLLSSRVKVIYGSKDGETTKKLNFLL